MNTQPMGPSAMVLVTKQELAALLSLRMASDPMPIVEPEVELVDKALDRFSQQLGADNWIDAAHRLANVQAG